MVYTLEEIAQRVRPVAEKFRLRAVYVFGSYARGEATEDSDVDLLVDATNSGLVGWEYGDLYNDLEEAIGKEIDMVTIRGLERPPRMESDIYFRENVNRERKCIYAVA